MSIQVEVLKIRFKGRAFAAGLEEPKRKHTVETPPMIAERSLMPAGNPCPVMK